MHLPFLHLPLVHVSLIFVKDFIQIIKKIIISIEITDSGASFGRSATWIHASGDQTFFRADDSLVTPDTLASANIFANSYCIGLQTAEHLNG